MGRFVGLFHAPVSPIRSRTIAAVKHRDLLRIVNLMQGLAPHDLDFAVLPGDNANDGTPEQFQIVRYAVTRLPLPLHILPGDHDFKPRTLSATRHCVASSAIEEA